MRDPTPTSRHVEVPDSVGSRQSAIETLYAAERSMGMALHTSTLYTTIANLTYLGVILGLWFGSSKGVTTLPDGASQLSLIHLPPGALIVLPIPAWGLASYHVVQFAMVTSHGHSIAVLEKELVIAAGYAARRDEIGSRAEELSTNVKMKQNPAMFIVTLLAYGVAFVGVVGFAAVCLLQIVEVFGWRSGWSITSIVLNILAAACVGFGFRYASGQLDRSSIWADYEATVASDSESETDDAVTEGPQGVGVDGRRAPKTLVKNAIGHAARDWPSLREGPGHG